MSPNQNGSDEITGLARQLWNYHYLRMPESAPGEAQADALIVCGSNDLKVAEWAARLYHAGAAPVIVCSGGTEHATFAERFSNNGDEASAFAAVLQENGVPASAIILENQAHNTVENMTRSAAVLQEHNLPMKKVILVCARAHERRSFATAHKQIPEAEVIVSSPEISFEEYIGHAELRGARIRALLGHTARLYLYGLKGSLQSDSLPEPVLEAYRTLVCDYGFTPTKSESLAAELAAWGEDVALDHLAEQYREHTPEYVGKLR